MLLLAGNWWGMVLDILYFGGAEPLQPAATLPKFSVTDPSSEPAEPAVTAKHLARTRILQG